MKKMFLSLLFLGMIGSSLKAQILYEDHFSGGTTDLEWTSHWGEESNDVLVDFLPGNPSGDGFVGKLGNDLSGGGVGSVFHDVDGLTDYMVSAQFLLNPGETHYRGLVGRSTGVVGEAPPTFYSFLADLSVGTGMGDQRFRLRLHGLAEFPSVIHDWSMADLGNLYPDSEDWYKLSLRMEGNQIWCYINDTVLPGCPFTDSNLPEGSFGIYFWDFTAVDDFVFFDDVVVEGTETAVSENLPRMSFDLLPNMPNPFNPTTLTRFKLEQSSAIELGVYNLKGQLVNQLASGQWAAGLHQVRWDGTNSMGTAVASGHYLLRLQSGDQVQTEGLLLQR